MSSKFRWLIVLVSTPLVVLVTLGGLLTASNEPGDQRAPAGHLIAFEDVISLVLGAYVEEVNVDRVMEGAMRGLTDGLDRSSAYLSPEEVRAIETKTPAPPADVGLVVTRQFYLRVVGVRDGSPAAKAGLQTDDFIRMIDATPTRDMSAVTGVRMLHGAPGSTVKLTVIRGNAADPHEFTLTREAPTGPPVVSTVLPSGVAHVRVARFTADAVPALKRAFDGFAAKKVEGAVIDLRATADGTPEDGIAAARLFVSSGTLAVRAGRGEARVTIAAEPGDGAITMPVGLLVSNGTANAAEVFAAALSGNSRAELIGEPTAGIAAVQKLVKLPENRGLWITSERYLQVDGKDPIHERGLRPTLGVEIPSVGFDEVPPAADEPLAKAVERMRSKYLLTVNPGR
jgi:carboxyl-terminal processing protease